ncbi:MAG: TatD family hydrolase [Bdellovibrionales bacterium]|nr:TatD family hydrolase [Bdellovibrionales bacterium]
MLIDVHTHLDELELNPETAIAEAKRSGIDRLITIGTKPDDLNFVVEMTKKFPGVVFGSLGIHPHESASFNPKVRETMVALAANPGIVAIGEIGLDYYYNHAQKDVQKQAFREQVELAVELGLPLEIHTRDAEEDTIKILQDYRGKLKGLIHCFTGTRWLAEKALDLDFNVSFSGIVTFKNAESLRDTARVIPLDRLHVETDAPFLAPVPHRGKKNLPSYLTHTAQFISDLKGVSLEKLTEQLNQNAQDLFPRLKS